MFVPAYSACTTKRIQMDEVIHAKQKIMFSGSFHLASVYDLAGLEEAVASYIVIAARKLRDQQSLAGMLQGKIRAQTGWTHRSIRKDCASLCRNRPTILCNSLRS